MDYLVISYGFMFLSILITGGASIFIRYTYNKYSKVKTKSSGSEIARELLKKEGMEDVYVVSTNGTLTDHYDPSRKVVRLSHDNYDKNSVSAVFVSLHECGHAMQDRDNYTLMKLRSTLVPIVNFTSKAGYIVLLIGILANAFDIIWAGIILEMGILLFQLVTLPVEVNASRRAIEYAKESNQFNAKELEQGKIVLIAAALTYVAGVLTAVLDIIRLIILYGGRNRD